MSLSFLFVDFNAYFASVEQQERPELRGKPVVVAPMMTDSTCAIAASYEAKRYGIKTGTGIGEAKAICPTLHVVEARHHLYIEYH
ncbi:MAG: DNA polymerase Y family protein, partial [Bacteroidota bacterium]